MKTLAQLAENGRINQDASIRDGQSIIINAPIGEVWNTLTDLTKWAEWNSDVKSVKAGSMEVGSEFELNVAGICVTSTIRKILPPEQITWTGSSPGVKLIQVWRLEEGDRQTIVSTEESIQGLRTVFYSHQRLHSTLINWLERLKQRVEQQ